MDERSDHITGVILSIVNMFGSILNKIVVVKLMLDGEDITFKTFDGV